jgi:hypothetical protein
VQQLLAEIGKARTDDHEAKRDATYPAQPLAQQGVDDAVAANEAHVRLVECTDTTGAYAFLACTLNGGGSFVDPGGTARTSVATLRRMSSSLRRGNRTNPPPASRKRQAMTCSMPHRRWSISEVFCTRRTSGRRRLGACLALNWHLGPWLRWLEVWKPLEVVMDRGVGPGSSGEHESRPISPR